MFPEEALGSPLNPLGRPPDPLGEVRSSRDVVFKYVFRSLGKFGQVLLLGFCLPGFCLSAYSSHSFTEVESARVAPTLDSTRAGGHDDST